MTHLTVGKRIIIGFSSLLLIMIALSAFAYVHLLDIRDRAIRAARDSWPGMHQMARIDSLWSERYALLWEYLSEPDGAGKGQVEARMRANLAALDAAMQRYEGTVHDADDRRLFLALQQAGAEFNRREVEATVAGRTASGVDIRGWITRQVQPSFRRVNSAIAAEIQYNKTNGDQHNQSILEAVSTALRGIPVALGIGFILAVAAVALLVRAINRPLAVLVGGAEVMRTGNFSQRLRLDRNDEFGVLAAGLNLMATDLTNLISRVQKSGLQVNASATEIAATAQEQLSTANEIASTTAEIGATSKEISATSKGLAQTMRDVSNIADTTAKLAVSGQSGLDRMSHTMQRIMDASASITTRLAVLSEKAGNIGLMVTTITKVADQTNLLSLNAAIEAEKAGEYGRGFSVVATEIRRLADQTAGATNDIEQMVKEIQSAVTAGVMGMDKFAEEVRRGVEAVQQVNAELSQIIEQVQTLTPSFETVTEGVESQSLGAQQISDALAQLSEASRQTVDSLRQSNKAIEQLNDAARALQSGVMKFVLAA